MTGTLTLEALRDAVDAGSIDTVAVCMVDMQGRLMGKRLHARYFLDHGHEETHCCNYLLATDLEMETPDGYASTSWAAGYGDYMMKPDLGTLRLTPWAEGAAMVLCDVLDHAGDAPIEHSPRAMLRKQLKRLEAHGWSATAATELEFFLYDDSYEAARDKRYADLEYSSPYNEDYHLFQTAKEEHVMRPIRNHLAAAGIPVEGTKGEAAAGQAELNIVYDEALACADMHAFAKHAVKEIAWGEGRSVTFLAKPAADTSGSASHVHLSLRDEAGANVFFDEGAEHGMSTTMRRFLAGLIAHADDFTVFLAPYVNSYKRFAAGTFAPTKNVWSIDNRTAGFRICGPDSKGVRVECRIGGADLNPYLALAGMIAAGLAGVEGEMEPPEAFEGDAYGAGGDVPEVPKTLRDATEAMRGSTMLREAFGDAVVDHYTRMAEVEREDFERAVTDHEIRRGFERA